MYQARKIKPHTKKRKTTDEGKGLLYQTEQTYTKKKKPQTNKSAKIFSG